MAKLSPEKIKKLKNYFEKREDVSMAFLFGSYAKGNATKRSDADVAVYFKPTGRAVEWEERKTYPALDDVWSVVERIVGVSTDVVVLNRAPAALADAIVREGIPLAKKDDNLYWRFHYLVGDAAEYFRIFARDFAAIKRRSASLSDNDAYRLERILDFIATESKDFATYKDKDLKQRTYENDRAIRLPLERWVETMVNAALDAAKILLASEKKRIPVAYEDILLALDSLDGFDPQVAEQLSKFAKLRNILAHEYLDIRFDFLKRFIDEAEPLYRKLAEFVGSFLEKQRGKSKKE